MTFPVKWQVVDAGGKKLFALTPKDYENLAKTQSETLRWVKEARSQLDTYRKAQNVSE